MGRDANLMKSSGIKLQGVQLYVEQDIKDVQKDPELEKYIFIPYLNLDNTTVSTEMNCKLSSTVLCQLCISLSKT
jgi:hypothetical protein